MIREGQGGEAAKGLRGIELEKLGRSHLPLFANIARRSGRPELAIRALNKLIRRDRKIQSPPKIDESLEYAAALITIGACDEGMTILQDIPEHSCAELFLYQAFGLISQWNYVESIPVLRKYLASTSNPYQRLVGNINLAAGLVAEDQIEEAQEILFSSLAIAVKSNAVLLSGNCYEQ